MRAELTYATLSRPPLVLGLPQPVLLAALVAFGPALWAGWPWVAALAAILALLRLLFQYEPDVYSIALNALRHSTSRRLS